jgi:thioesterase domain-containing protein
MAASYVDRIRAIQPEGPYHLLGWSLGGIVAHEMAVQLQQAGQAVAALVMMDSYPHDQIAALSGEHAGALNLVEPQILAQFSGEEIAAGKKIAENNAAIMARHVPGLYDGDVLLFVATEDKAKDAKPAQAWAPYLTGQAREVPVPCGHNLMTQPAMLALVGETTTAWLRDLG